MQHSLCKICGERHALGFCPEFAEYEPPQSQGRPVEAGPARPRPREAASIRSGGEQPLALDLPPTVPRSAGERRADGVSQSRRPLGRPLEKDRHLSLAQTKPWQTEGMSRATWFRRQHEA